MSFLSRSLLCGTAALGLLAVTPGFAQDRYEDVDYHAGPIERIEVTAPPYRHERSSIGAPIQDVAMSREVRFDDLDLATRDGAWELRSRVRETARDLCNRLSVRYPVATEDSPPCYRTAVASAMDQVNDVIAQARRD